MACIIEAVPPEVIFHVIDFMDVQDLNKLRQTSNYLKSLADDNQVSFVVQMTR
jgi:hypothetical protein